MIGSPVAEFELVGFSAERVAEKLVAKANPKHRLFAEQVLHGVNHGTKPGGIARTRGKKHAIGFPGEHFFGGSCGGKNNASAAGGGEPAKNVELQSAIQHHKAMFESVWFFY